MRLATEAMPVPNVAPRKAEAKRSNEMALRHGYSCITSEFIDSDHGSWITIYCQEIFSASEKACSETGGQ